MKVGDVIRFRYTGVRAEITIDYMDGSYAVWLFDDREESIAFDDDIVLDSAFKGVEQSALSKERNKKKPKVEKKMSTEEMFFSKEELGKEQMAGFQKKKSILQKPKSETGEEDDDEESTDFQAAVFQPQPPSDSGLWLAFVETAPMQFTIYLINDSLYSIRFEYSLQLLQMQKESLKQTINPNDYYPIGEFFYEELNDSPEIKISCPGLHLQEAFKLKFKNWMKMDGAVPLIGIETKCRLLFSTHRIEKAQQKGGQSLDIQSYTHEQVTEKVKKEVINRFYNKNDLQRLAHFEKEIDLHIEQLVDDHKTLTPNEIYDIQHIALDRYMMQAIELEVKEVYIIHGIGEGKLQRSVATHLQDLQRRKLIKEFKNEYIDGYGFGATRVVV